MIRHSNSFLISLLFHLSLVFVLYSLYKEVHSFIHTKHKEDRVCVSLCCLENNKDMKKVTPEKTKIKPQKDISKKEEVKKIIHKPVKKTLEVKKEYKVKKLKEIKKVKSKEKKVVTKTLKTQKKQSVENPKPIKKVITRSIKKEIPKVINIPKQKSTSEIYIDKNLEIIKKLLQDNLYYPRRARKRGIEGDVTVHFKILKSAEVTDIEVLSSKSSILSRGAVKTLEDLSFEFPKPLEDMSITIPIRYRLR